MLKSRIIGVVKIIGLGFFLSVFFLAPVQAQVRAGFGYLKMLHGAREVSKAGTLAAALDHTYSFYGNPAATGLIREWQWSATYTNWISDIYNASLLYGGSLRTPWSRWTRFMVGINYLGIPEFNNANQSNTPVSGNNFILTGSIGQPISFLTRNLALGGNFKYYDSKLADFKASSVIFDLGMLYRTPRFALKKLSGGLLDYIILSSGFAWTNLGAPIKVIAEETPLPRTFRAGLAVNVGAHRGFQINLGGDYRKIRDEAGFITWGAELSWRQLLTFRMGFSEEENLLGSFTFGGGLQLDDQIINRGLFQRNNAIKVDLASIENNSYFAAPYHGTLTFHPVAPEHFRLRTPAYGAVIDADQVELSWEDTRDPDLYDDYGFRIWVTRDSLQLARVVERAEKEPDSLPQLLDSAPLLVDQSLNQTTYKVTDLVSGSYFWTVGAWDRDNHARFGTMRGRKIARFHVTMPEPRVIACDFDYHPWITLDDYQGKLRLKITNVGDRSARDFFLTVSDSLIDHTNKALTVHSGERSKKVTRLQSMPELAPGDTTWIELDWHAKITGLYDIIATIHKSTENQVVDKFTRAFYSIPKGTFTIGDTVYTQNQYKIIYDLPYVGKVFFDSLSAVIQEFYIRNWIIEPPLSLFARRLKDNPGVKILLQGTIDPNSGETDIQLAQDRATAVHDTLLSLGVKPGQIEILAGLALPIRTMPKNPEDARWVLEERRRVDITTDSLNEEILFQPLQTTFIEKTDVPLVFDADIRGAVAFTDGNIALKLAPTKEKLKITQELTGHNLVKKLEWAFMRANQPDRESWLQNNADYLIQLSDSLNRQFAVHPKVTFLTTKSIGSERRYYILANFAKSTAFYNFYWSNLMKTVPTLIGQPNIDIQFLGHGCATGPEKINDALSKKRAVDFMNMFTNDLQVSFPNLAPQITRIINPPEGFGEFEPLSFKTETGKLVLLGDNQSPLGRQLNRRVMVFFHSAN